MILFWLTGAFAMLGLSLMIYGIFFSLAMFFQGIVAIKGPKWSIWILPLVVTGFEVFYWIYYDVQVDGVVLLMALLISAFLPVVLILEGKLFTVGKEKWQAYHRNKRQNKEL